VAAASKPAVGSSVIMSYLLPTLLGEQTTSHPRRDRSCDISSALTAAIWIAPPPSPQR